MWVRQSNNAIKDDIRINSAKENIEKESEAEDNFQYLYLSLIIIRACMEWVSTSCNFVVNKHEAC